MLKGSDEQCVASRWEISRISVGGGCQAAGRTGGKEGRGGGGGSWRLAISAAAGTVYMEWEGEG